MVVIHDVAAARGGRERRVNENRRRANGRISSCLAQFASHEARDEPEVAVQGSRVR